MIDHVGSINDVSVNSQFMNLPDPIGKSTLIKLSAGAVQIGEALDFAVYDIDGKLLLQQGNVIHSEGLIERLYRLGYRERLAEGVGEERKPAINVDKERRQELSGATRLDISGLDDGGERSTLPKLRQNVEFFHLMRAGSKDVICMELTGVIPEEALIVRHTAAQTLPLVMGVDYEARLFAGSRLYKFETKLLPGGVSPLSCHFLQYPQTVSQAIVRRHHRVPTSINAKLHTNDYSCAETDVIVENLSTSGAGISTSNDVLSVGQHVRLAANILIDGRMRRISMLAEVRNRRTEKGLVKLGLEFAQVPDEVRRDIRDVILDNIGKA